MLLGAVREGGFLCRGALGKISGTHRVGRKLSPFAELWLAKGGTYL